MTVPSYAVNPITINGPGGPTLVRPGSLVTDSSIQTAYTGGGGILAPASDPNVAAAAAIVAKMKARGQDDALCAQVMQAAYSSSGSSGTDNGVTPDHVVRLATAAALATSVYDPVAQTITATGTTALTVDGTTAAVGDRILVRNQATGSQNGVYSVLAVGGSGTSWQLQRQFDFSASAQFQPGLVIQASEGSANANTLFELATAAPIVLDTTSLTFNALASSVSAATVGLQSGTSVLVSGVSAAIPANITATSRIVVTRKDIAASTSIGVLAAKSTDRSTGSPGSFKVTSENTADGTTDTSDVSTFDWIILG